MPYITADRVKETTIIVGTGTVSLLGTSTGFRTFASQMTVGDTCSYIISNASGSEWESGIATYSSANTLTRTSVNSSSNSNNRVVFTGGVKDVFIGVTADSVVDKNNARLNTINAIPVASGVGNDLTLIAGSGVGVGAGGNIVLTPGSQGSSGGDGKVLIDGLTVGGAGSISNAALGYNALKEGASIWSVAVGSEALAVNRGLGNSALGSSALKNNTNGNGNTAIGDKSSFSSTEGSVNTSIGGISLYELTTGSNNIALGAYAGNSLTTGSNNIFIGVSVNSPTASTSDFLTIGNVIFASGGFGIGTTVGVGNVGIGQNAPTAKLHVTGTSASTKVAIVQGASSQTANLQEWQNSSSTALTTIDSNGRIYVGNGSIGDANNAAIGFGGDPRVGFSYNQTTKNIFVSNNGSTRFVLGGIGGGSVIDGFAMLSSASLSWSTSLSTAGPTAPTLSLNYDAADTLAQRRSTNAQTFRIYNTYTDASNYERLGITWASNICTISPENAGTGVARRMRINFGDNGNVNIQSTSTNNLAIVTGGIVAFASTSGGLAFRSTWGGSLTPVTFGQGNAGNPNRNGDPYVFRITGGSGNTDPGYIGFGAAYVPVGATSTTGHTQQDALLIKLLAVDTTIAAFGASFASTVPAIKRVGTRLQARLADDSGYATWEGPLNSNAVSAIALPTAATVTAATGDGTTATYTAANTFSVGQTVSIVGLTTTTGSSLNLANQTITTVSSTQFTVTNSTVGTAVATQAGTATIQSAGNSVTITAGNGSGAGAGGNIILQPGAQGSSGGDGIIQCTKKLQFYTGSSKTDLAFQINNTTTGMWYNSGANMFVWTINNTDTICFRQGYIRLSKGGGIYWSNTTNDAITLPDDTSIYSASRGVFAVDAPMQGTNSQGGSLAFKSFTTNFAANTNDWVMGPSAFQRLNCTTACSLTGIAPYTSGTHVDGRMVRVYNVGTANLTLAHNSTSSIAANRFWNSTGADIVLSTHQYVELIYDSTDNGRGAAGWRISSIH